LHLAGPFCSDAQVDDWIRQYEEKGAPEWVKADEFPKEPERRGQAAEERRQAHDRLCQAVDGLTRTQAGKRLLEKGGVHLLDTIAAKHKVEVIGFAQESWDVKSEQLEELFRQLREEASGGREPPDSKSNQGAHTPRSPQQSLAYTDLRLPLEEALKRSGQDEG